jgi:hypothetical protein
VWEKCKLVSVKTGGTCSDHYSLTRLKIVNIFAVS